MAVLLITSRNGRGWVVPKGGWELDETLEAAAARETLEEAGVRGRLEDQPVGAFFFTSDKVVGGSDPGPDGGGLWFGPRAHEPPLCRSGVVSTTRATAWRRCSSFTWRRSCPPGPRHTSARGPGSLRRRQSS